MARRFFFVSAGLFLLALAYQLGVTTATAQAPSNSVVAVYSGGNPLAVTANGDCFLASDATGSAWTRTGNVFAGATPALKQTWSELKARYR
jgi:hypothetical protein